MEPETLFKTGNEWVRIDLHLHTKAESNFKYNGDNFEMEYIDALKDAGISIGAITNHNKFDYDEFVKLKKLARDRNIWLLPGVELEVSDGKRGIHVLVIFNNKDMEKNKDFISNFIIRQEDPVTNSPHKTLEDLIDELEKLKRDYLLIFAHVDNTKGFLKELRPANYKAWIKKRFFREKIIALQDINGSSINSFENVLKTELHDEWQKSKPAYVSFIDPKCISDIKTKNKKTYIRIGDFDFSALKFALLNYEVRLKEEKPKSMYSQILSMEVKNGNFINNKVFHFNNSLNTLIGVRGSGKSTIIELLRWAFGKEPLQNSDTDYKNDLIHFALGNGGEIILTVRTKDGFEYKIKRNYTDFYPTIVDKSGTTLSIKKVSELFDIVYFGQKDLSEISKNTEKQLNLIDEFIKGDIKDLKSSELNLKNEIREIIRRLKNIKDETQDIETMKENIELLKQKIKIFKERGVDKLLEKQINFEKEKEKAEFVLNSIKEATSDIVVLIESINQRFEMILEYSFDKYGESFKKKIYELRSDIINKLEGTKKSIELFFESVNKEEIKKADEDYNKLIKELNEVKKQIDENLDTRFYINTNKEIQHLEIKIKELQKKDRLIEEYEEKIKEKIEKLKDIQKQIYEKRKNFSKKIEQSLPFLKLELEFQGDKIAFKNFLRNKLRGSGIRDNKIGDISKKFYDGYNLYKAVKNKEGILVRILGENYFSKFKEKIKETLEEIIIFSSPDRINIQYKIGKNEFKSLEKLSIGQRAASILALILYHRNIPIIIDQPEDDIDNSTIYEGIIKTILQKKDKNQFIFATHNSNIVVLGDSDNVFICNNEADELKKVDGSIDKNKIQKDIVAIMEGGKEAFDKRKIIYRLWG